MGIMAPASSVNLVYILSYTAPPSAVIFIYIPVHPFCSSEQGCPDICIQQSEELSSYNFHKNIQH